MLVAGLTLAALPAAPALAVPVGQTGGDGIAVCPVGDVVRADLTYVVPAGGGTITSFSFESSAGNAGYQLDFMVLRPTGGNTYTVVGKTGVVTLQGTGLETFGADIAVQGGEIIGFWQAPGNLAACGRFGGAEGLATSLSSGNPSVGDSISLTGPITLLSLNLSANLFDATEQQGRLQERRLEGVRQPVQEPGPMRDHLRRGRPGVTSGCESPRPRASCGCRAR